MAKKELPALDFVVEELILEGVGGSGARARSLAEALEEHVVRGESLANYRAKLAKAVGSFADKSARVRTLRVVATEASRAGDDKTLSKLEALDPSLRAKLDKLTRQESAKPKLALCDRIERACVEGKPVSDEDVARVAGWLGSPPEGRGHARVDVALHACIALMRVVCHPRAGKNARELLERKLEGSGPAANDARRALVAAAAYQERWRDVDALCKVTGPALSSAVDGLDLAAGYRLSDRPLAQARAERGAALPEFRPELESRLRAIAKRGSAAVAKLCDNVLARLARGR